MTIYEIDSPYYQAQRACIKYKIENYTIHPDGSVDVAGNVRLVDMNLSKLPINFNKN